MKNLTKTALVTAVAGLTSLTLASNTFALEPGAIRNAIRSTVRQEINQQTAAVTNIASAPGQTLRNEIRKETQNLKKNILDTVKDKIKNLLPRSIRGTIASIAGDGSSLTVTTANRGTVTVYVSDKTQLKRRFGGNSSLSEFAVGDEVAVIGSVRSVASSSSASGTATDNSIDARYIRDLSIQRRNTVFVGKITALGTDNFTIQTVSRGVQTVYVLPTTVISQRDIKLSFSDLKAGDRVLVKGVIWDRALTKINAAMIIKLPSVPASGSSSSAQTSSAASSTSSSSSSESAQSSSSSVI